MYSTIWDISKVAPLLVSDFVLINDLEMFQHMVLRKLQLTVIDTFTLVVVKISSKRDTGKLGIALFVMVKVAVDKISRDFQGLKLTHERKINSTKIIARQLQDQMLYVDKLAEEESFVHESLRPF